jgi:hypothetical protein
MNLLFIAHMIFTTNNNGKFHNPIEDNPYDKINKAICYSQRKA